MKQTQQQRILTVLETIRDRTHDIAGEYIRRHPIGDGLSARYFKQIMLISEVNGRISELRAKGYDIETSRQKDAFGFAYHRLKGAGVALSPIARAAEMCRLFDLGRPAEEIFAA